MPFHDYYEQLHGSLDGYEPKMQQRDQHLGLWSSVLRRLRLGSSDSGGSNTYDSTMTNGSNSSNSETPRGVYMHGGVGTGKTFMMDLFFQVWCCRSATC